ncbi:hypothetical protein ACIOWG_27475 [Streptomyces sp. NPDC087658]|uniref:hypothetical protein n=1 Tax=Streptomyces sp. NPDC087658 TaxID=3365800 RepID=UPI00381D2701
MRLQSILALDDEGEADPGSKASGVESRVTSLFARLARETSGIQELDTLMDPHPMPASYETELTGTQDEEEPA